LVGLGRCKMRSGGGEVLARRIVYTVHVGLGGVLVCAIMNTRLLSEHFTMLQEA